MRDLFNCNKEGKKDFLNKSYLLHKAHLEGEGKMVTLLPWERELEGGAEKIQ